MRNADKAKLLESKFPVKAVIGSLEDLDKLAELAENAHVVIQTVSTTEDRVSAQMLTTCIFRRLQMVRRL